MRQHIFLFPARYISTFLLVCALCSPTAAQPVKNQILSGYQVRVESKCSLFKINFNHRIRYVSHFPSNSGTALRIMLRPIDPRQFDLDAGSAREALRPPQDRRAGINAIQFEAAIAEGPTLTILFDRSVNFDAAGGADFQSLVFSVTDIKNGKACKPVYPGQAANGWEPVVTGRQPPSKMVAPRQAATPVVIPDVPVTPGATPPGSGQRTGST